jgi:hypothetical protein
MTLPTSPPISITQINAEFGIAVGAVWPAAYYGKGGAPSSGALSFADFLGRSSGAIYTPAPGSYQDVETGHAEFTISADRAVTWTWSRTTGTSGTVTDQNGTTFTSGGTATSLTFGINGTTSITRAATFSVQSGGKSWTIYVEGDSTSGSGGTCVVISSMILMADGTEKKARDLVAGDYVWTQHEHTRQWGIHRVSAVSFHLDKVVDVPGHPLATKRHRFALPWKGWWRAGWIGRDAGEAIVAKITVEDAHTYMARRPGHPWRLSHNIKQ